MSLSPNNSPIFCLLKDGRSSVQAIIRDWIKVCRSNEDEALLQIIQLIISSCGASYVMKEEKVSESSVSQMLNDCLLEGFAIDKNLPFDEYPLSPKNTKTVWRRFREKFLSFVQNFFEMAEDLLLEKKLVLDKILELLFDMISSRKDEYVKCYLHTAILFGLKLNTKVIQSHCKLISEVADQEKSSYKNSDILEQLKEKLNYVTNVNENLNRLISIGYIHEIEDVQCAAIRELGIWMYQDSQMYLSDEYLKYFHRVLHDLDSPHARIEAMRALIPLYELSIEDNVIESQMEPFTDKVFIKIFVTACNESNIELSLLAHKIIILLHRMGKDKFIVSYKDILKIFVPNLIREKRIAYASAEYLYERLKRNDNNKLKTIKSFIKLFIDSNIERCDQFMCLFVDSLLKFGNEMLDINVLLEMMTSSKFTDEEQILVCHLFYALIKVLTDQTRLNTRNHKLNKREIDKQRDKKKQFTRLILTKFSDIIKALQYDTAKLIPLVKTINLIDKQNIKRSDEKTLLQGLLKDLMNICNIHSDECLIVAIGATMRYFCEDNYPEGEFCLNYVISLFDERVKELSDNLSRYFGDSNMSNKKIKTVLPDLRIMKYFFKFIHLPTFKCLFENLEKILHHSIDEDVPDIIIKEVLAACTYYIQGYYGEIVKDDRASANTLDDSHQLVLNYSLICINKPGISETAFECICHILLSYKKGLKDIGCYSNIYDCKAEIIPNSASEMKKIGLKMQDFIEKYVFLKDGCLTIRKRLEHLKLYFTVVMSSRLLMQYAHFVFLYWNKDEVYKPLMKQFFDWCRNTSRANLSRTIIYGFGLAYKNSKCEILELRKLSKQVILNFGPKLEVNHHAVRALHEEGIVFSIRHQMGKYIEFLQVVSEWSSKLLKDDKEKLKEFLDDQVYLEFS